jgi:hypothetical protein
VGISHCLLASVIDMCCTCCHLQWSPTTPGVFSTSTFEGKVNINNILECTAGSAVETFNADFTVSTGPAGERQRAAASGGPAHLAGLKAKQGAEATFL